MGIPLERIPQIRRFYGKAQDDDSGARLVEPFIAYLNHAKGLTQRAVFGTLATILANDRLGEEQADKVHIAFMQCIVRDGWAAKEPRLLQAGHYIFFHLERECPNTLNPNP